MTEVTLGQVSSHPDENGKHTLKCPACSTVFKAAISKDDATDILQPVACPTCKHNDEPMVFIAAAHQSEVNAMATQYVQDELDRSLGKLFR